jgi:hypothetical protein
MDDSVRITLAEDWGYALEFGTASRQRVENALQKPESREAKLLALAVSDPKRFPLSVESSRELPREAVPAGVWTRDASGKFLNAKAQSLDGNAWNPGMHTVFSPASPDAFWEQAAELSAAPIRRLREKCPIAFVLNAGEYGLGVAGFAREVWQQDPAVVEARKDQPWGAYISKRKSHYQGILTRAERAAAPDRLLYIYYTCGGELGRLGVLLGALPNPFRFAQQRGLLPSFQHGVDRRTRHSHPLSQRGGPRNARRTPALLQLVECRMGG